MDGKAVPEELHVLRKQIDHIDDQLMELLARRFEVTREVGRLKARQQLSSLDPKREQEKLERIRQQAQELSLNPEFVLRLFEILFAEVVSNHKSYLGQDRG